MDEKIFAFFLPFLFALAVTGPPEDPLQTEFAKRLSLIHKRFVPDGRLDLLTAEAQLVGGRWQVNGETTVPSARQAVEETARAVFGSRLGKVDLKVLPDNDGEAVEGLVRVSVAPLRKVPKHSAEMVDQIVMGTAVRVLKEEPGWILIQTPYRYLGWVEKLMLARLPAEELDSWNKGRLARFAEPSGTIWASPDQLQPVADIVLGCTVLTSRSDGVWTEIQLPDRRRGYVPTRSLLSTSQATAKPDRHSVVSLARRLFGIPYLWGGNSTKGFDCSGFTQTVFKMHNLVLPRDADQQAAVGRQIEPHADFSNVLPGDLLFFGTERITHVAISLGGGEYIQASGDVNIKSLNSNAAGYDAERESTLRQIRRVLE